MGGEEGPPPRVSRGWGLLRVLPPGAHCSDLVATPLTDSGRPGRCKLGDSTLRSQAFRTHLELWDSRKKKKKKSRLFFFFFFLRTVRPLLDSCSHLTDEKIEAGECSPWASRVAVSAIGALGGELSGRLKCGLGLSARWADAGTATRALNIHSLDRTLIKQSKVHYYLIKIFIGSLIGLLVAP